VHLAGGDAADPRRVDDQVRLGEEEEWTIVNPPVAGFTLLPCRSR
jgi:hypothetical protein